MSAESPAVPAASRLAPARPQAAPDHPQATPDSPQAAPGRPGLWAGLDYAIAALLAVVIFGVLFRGIGVYEFPLNSWGAHDWGPPLLAVGLCVPVAVRRRAPLRAFIAILALNCVTITIGGEITRGAFLPLAFVLYLVAATSRRNVAMLGLAASLAVLAAQGLVLHLNGLGSGNAVLASLVMIICWTAGYAVQQRRAYAAHLRDQAASTAVTAERLRIARELHDVVAHSMTVVAVQAGFGEYVFDSQPGEARAALGAIQMVSREALGDMQRLLGVLRHAAEQDGDARDASQAGSRGPDGGGYEAAAEPGRARGIGHTAGTAGTSAPLAPAPGLADLDRLVARTAGAGVQVAVERTGRVRGIPAGIDLSAYRIVQEALTNVVKHSGAGRCRVVIGYGASDLFVQITDPGPGDRGTGGSLTATPPRSGHGITGMRERVSLCGGEFSAAPLPGQGFKVAARLPLASGAP